MYNRQDIQRVRAVIAPAARMGVISNTNAIISTLENALAIPNVAETELDDYMTKDEVMEFFTLKEPTYYDWLRRGWLRPYGIGRKVRFLRSEVITLRKKGEK